MVSGGYFADSVVNIFPDRALWVNFLVKFYQCLLAGKLPLKTPKLCLVGPSDLGKSSLASVLFGLTQRDQVATISKERAFGLSMVNDSTQLVFVDEMNEDLLPADLAKIFLQGGLLTVSRKHVNAQIVQNNAGKYFCPYFSLLRIKISGLLGHSIRFSALPGVYITCNQLPNYGPEQEHVMRRLHVFHTRSLAEKNVEAPAWMEKNAFNILLWMVKEMREHKKLIDQSELFFLRRIDDPVSIKVKHKYSTNPKISSRFLCYSLSIYECSILFLLTE